MNCERFTLWLDAGADSREADVLRAHARDCVRCAREFEAARAIEAALAAPAPAAPALPADFTDRVMARALPRVALAAAPSTAPLWTRVLRDPWVLSSAAMLAAAVAWRGPITGALLGATRRVSGEAQAVVSGPLQSLTANATLDWALVLTALAAVLAACWVLVHWAQGWNAAPLQRR